MACHRRVTAVGGSTLICKGWLPVKFKIGNHVTEQPVYICFKVDRIYFSRDGCLALGILPPSFSYPMPVESVHALTDAWVEIPK